MGSYITKMFDNSALVKLATVDFLMQYSVFFVSALFETEKLYDLTGSATFVFLMYLSSKWNSAQSLRQAIQSGMISIWAIRLGSFLFTRVLKSGKDRRFNKVRDNPPLFFIFWTLQGFWIFITLLPSLMLMNRSDYTPLTYRDSLGFGLWTVGFAIEVIADFQKSVFRNKPENEGKFIRTGLWSISRHPNYLGEILLWFGLYFSASSTFKGREMLTVLCPVFDMFLITKVTGIPPLEKYGMQKWGRNPSYIYYIRKTATLIPYIC